MDGFQNENLEDFIINKTYEITLSDGRKISNLKMNGNNFVSKLPIEKEIFEGNLSKVTISDGDIDQTYDSMRLIQISEIDGEWYFILDIIPENELLYAKIKADIDYITMMSDIEF